jgi:hypothetical protein
MAKTMKPGQIAPRSGEYEIRGPRGGAAGTERTIVRGKPLPPMSKLRQSYTLHSKSGRVIIASPAKSANTVESWSKAFKK